MFIIEKERSGKVILSILITVLFLGVSLPVINGMREEKTSANIEDIHTEDFQEGTRKPQFTPTMICEENMVKSAYPMDLVTYNCTVQNDGNMVDDYKIITTNVYGWDIIPYPEKFTRIPPVSGPADDIHKYKSLTVRIVVGDLYNATVGKYPIDVTLKSSLCPANKSTLTFTVDVLLLHRPNIMAPEPAYRLPGEDVLYEFQIQNLGNGDDIFDVWVESSDYEWVAQLVDPNQEILELQQWRTVIVPVLVFLPEDVDAGKAQITTLVVRPKEDPGSMQERDFVQTMVTHIYGIEVNKDEMVKMKDGKPGGYVTFDFEIINVGNDLDDVIGSQGTFEVSRAPDIPTEWDMWMDSSDIREGGLPKDLEADIEFKVKVPPSTPVGEYDFTVDVLSEVPLKFQDEAIFTVNVLPDFNAEMEFNNTAKSAMIRDNISFGCLLRNTGNILDTYLWEIESDYSSWVYVKEPVFEVDFGYEYEPEFKIGIPGDTPAGTYEFKLLLGSQGDCNITFEKKFTLVVMETLDFDFLSKGETHDAIPKGETTIRLRVQNSGNADVTLSFEIFGESWGLLGKKNLFLRYKETKEVPISFKPPEDVKRKGYTFEILGGITVGSDVTKRTTVNIRVVEFEFAITEPALVGNNPMEEYSIKKEERHMFRVHVLNKGTQFFDSKKFGREITAKIYLNEQVIHSENITQLPGNAYYPITFNHSFKIAEKEEFILYTLGARISGVRDADPTNDVSEATVRVIGETAGEDEETGGIGAISASDYVYIFLIIFLSFAIALTSVVLIKRKYSIEKLTYDAKGDYDYSEKERDSFLHEEGGFDDGPDEEAEAAMMEMAYMDGGDQGMYDQGMYDQGMYDQGMYAQPGQDAYAYGGFADHGDMTGGYGEPSFQPGPEGFAQPQMMGAPPEVSQALPQVPPQAAPGVMLPHTTGLAVPEAQKALPPAGGLPGDMKGPVIVGSQPTVQPADVFGEQKKEPFIVTTTPPPTTGPVPVQTVPVTARTAPMVAGTAPVPAQTASVVAKTAPVPAQTASVVAKTAPIPAQTAPVVARTAPVPAQTAPVVARTAPVVARTAPIPAQTASVVAKTAPVPGVGGHGPPVIVAKTTPVSPAGHTTSENISDTTKRLEDILTKLNTQ